MLTLRNAPIKRKMILIGMLTSCVALLFTCGAFVVYEQRSSRNDLVKENLDAATLVGYNNTAALTFNDKDSAIASLRALKNDAAITAAAIYDKEGKLFAVYQDKGATAAVKLPSVEHNTHRFDEAGLSLFSDIVLDGETIGTVYIRHDLSETRATQRHYVTIAAWVMLVALLFQLGIQQRMSELGTLAAVGVGRRRISRLLAREGVIVAAVGATIGIVAGGLYAWLVIFGLTTWWVAAISTPFLRLHVGWPSLVIGWLVGVVVSWLVGGLNFQIEHHLFPKISHIHYPQISKIIKQACMEYGIQYIEYPRVRYAVASHVAFLRQMGRV